MNDVMIISILLPESSGDKSFSTFSLINDCSSLDFIISDIVDSIVMFSIGDRYTDLIWTGIDPLNE